MHKLIYFINHPLSYSAKTEIVQLIGEFISGQRLLELKKGELIHAQPKDSRMFQQRKKIF